MSAQHKSEVERARRLATQGQSEAAVELLDALSRSDPDNTDVLYALGGIARTAGLLNQAEAAYRAILDQRPNEVEAAVNIANVLVAKGNSGSAVRILTRIHNLAPDLLPAALALGAALLAEGRPDDALALFDHIVERYPDLSQAHANRAEVLSRLGRHAESLHAAEHAHRLSPDDPRIELNRAFALLTQGRVEEGLAAYEARLAPDLPAAALREGLDLPRWNGSSLPASGGPLLVVAEQGLGDEIRFAAAVRTLEQSGVATILEVEPRLVALFRRSLPTVTVVPHDRRRSGIKPIFRYRWLEDLTEPPAAWIEAGSLPLRLGPPRPRSIAPDGYLTPDRNRVAGFKNWLGSQAPAQRSVGIVWGSAEQGANRIRFYPSLEAWGPILGLPGVRFVDLQYVDSTADRAAFRSRFGTDILPVPGLDKRNDLDGAAALNAALDAVVGVSSSVAAMAGAVGTPTLEVISERTWIPKIGGRDLWLGPIRQVEPERPGDWADVMTRAAALLSARLAGS